MRRIKNLLLLVLVLLCFFVGLWTAQDNAQPVAVQLLGFAMPTFSLGAWLILVFAAGIALGLIASVPMIARARAESRRLRLHRNQYTGVKADNE